MNVSEKFLLRRVYGSLHCPLTIINNSQLPNKKIEAINNVMPGNPSVRAYRVRVFGVKVNAALDTATQPKEN